MADNDFGPKWVVSTDEVAGAGAIVGYFFIIALVLAPAFFLGLILAQKIWNVKIFKYLVAVLFAFGYLVLLVHACNRSYELAGAIAVGAWLLIDYVGAGYKLGEMLVVKSIVGIFKWLFSA